MIFQSRGGDVDTNEIGGFVSHCIDINQLRQLRSQISDRIQELEELAAKKSVHPTRGAGEEWTRHAGG